MAWEDRIATCESPIPDLLHLNKTEGDRAVAIFDKLRLPDVAGNPWLRTAVGWFRDIVRTLHGSYDPETAERAIREVCRLVARYLPDQLASHRDAKSLELLDGDNESAGAADDALAIILVERHVGRATEAWAAAQNRQAIDGAAIGHGIVAFLLDGRTAVVNVIARDVDDPAGRLSGCRNEDPSR